jgi:hypothetical protein
MRKLCVFITGFLSMCSLEAGTIRLINNSAYKLRAVIRANDGTFLGEEIITPQNNNTWNDGFNGLPGSLESVRSQTPYRVLWYCLDGSAFSTCSGVATGTTVTANGCDGARECRGNNRKDEEGGQTAPPMPLPSQPSQGNQQPQQQQQVPPYPAPQREYQNPQLNE